eukprot:CAMPEP_0184527402 /NCGR_PEP_ID=MMETSP0198_2-20121128/11176_1 /TAXON_ID=1112570 /ORGANISM="Thraustochytrium sp., Strain LLF1b" /LENGTH=63 /DNA_ID=CAMNT_0026919053 /DNA_START=1879 /DNA_END=2066 /DNA_ORIENTATION=+
MSHALAVSQALARREGRETKDAFKVSVSLTLRCSNLSGDMGSPSSRADHASGDARCRKRVAAV